MASIRLSKSPSWGWVVVCIPHRRFIQKSSFRTFAEIPNYEYGLTAAYGSSTASGNFGTTSQNIGYMISGLVPNTTYHFRLDASNTSGPSYGVDKTFTTLPTTTTAQNAWVSGTGGIGLRLRDAPSLSGNILLVMPEGAEVTLLSGTQSANGYLWRNVTYNSQTGWADSEYLVFNPTGTPTPPVAPLSLRQLQSDNISPIAAGGTVTASSVILAATTSGSSSQQYFLQFEVRPAGTAFRLQRLPARQFKEGHSRLSSTLSRRSSSR
jgi:hypothetical protein